MTAETRGLVVAGVKYDCWDKVARDGLNAKLNLSGGTMTGALNLKNNTWNNVGDEVAIGDTNVTGCISIKGLTGTTGINFVQYGGSAAGTIKWDGSKFILSAALPVASGGTGKTTNTANAVLVGNGDSAVKNIASANGAFYATAPNGVPQFGTLPVAQGGTGSTSVADIRTKLGLGSLALKSTVTLTSDVTGTLPTGHGGTGITSNPSMLVNLASTTAANVFASDPRPGITGKLAIENGGTNATNADAARSNLNAEKATAFTTFSGTSLTASANTEYSNNTAVNFLDITLPSAARGVIFGVNFTSSASFTGVTFSGTVYKTGEDLTQKSKRYNLIVWYDGNRWWCISKAV